MSCSVGADKIFIACATNILHGLFCMSQNLPEVVQINSEV